MPAINSEKNNFYIHIYNKSIDQGLLFKEDSDYKTFISYLQEYLSPQVNPDQLKTTFSVNGRSYQGVPHQPKNYLGKVELIAFSLLPNHFHLIVHETQKGCAEKLIRSLATRYVIYYNKKYQRNGSLFTGPYKATGIRDETELLLLTRHIHRESSQLKGFSSYKNYIGEIETNNWIKQEKVLSMLTNSTNSNFYSIKNYKSFVEDDEPSSDEIKMLESITFDKANEYRQDIAVPDTNITGFDAKTLKPGSKHRQKLPEFITVSIIIYAILTGLGYRNIQTSVTHSDEQISSDTSPTPQVAGTQTSEETNDLPTPTPTLSIETVESLTLSPSEITEFPEQTSATESSKKVEFMDLKLEKEKQVVIKSIDGSSLVNIFMEPSITSEVVAEARDGDTYELVSEMAEWYRILLTDGTGYVLVTSAQVQNGGIE